jgi:cytochrome c oxidase subunit 3
MSSEAHAVTTIESSGLKQPYHLVDPSPWPILGAFAGGLTVLGIVFEAHYHTWTLLIIGLLAVLAVMFFWWRDVLKESHTPGLHTPVVRLGLRYGMMFFITSEVMFFVAFFWAYFHYALFPEHVLGAKVLTWPPEGIRTFDPFHIPFLNTMILLLSGCTVTWAHHSLLENDRKGLIQGLILTVLLGMSFTGFQALEYSHAPFHFGGTIFLLVCLFRAIGGDFTPERHFGFEAAAWYWHFVDVVWLFLFTCIYWWGASPVPAA